MSQTEAKIETVTEAIQLYIDGVARGDKDLLERAFHADARMFGNVGDQRIDVPIADMIQMIAAQPADVDGKFQASIRSIEEEGDAAVAILDEGNFWGTLSFVDYFSLARIDGSWTIVNKVFAHTGGEPPAA